MSHLPALFMTYIHPPKGQFLFDGQPIEVAHGHSIFRALMGHGIAVNSSCDGGGSCGECLIHVVSGADALDEPTAEERDLPGGTRRACRTHWLLRDRDLHAMPASQEELQSLQEHHPSEGGGYK